MYICMLDISVQPGLVLLLVQCDKYGSTLWEIDLCEFIKLDMTV